MSSLNLKNSFQITVSGQVLTGQHGTSGDSAEAPFTIAVDGKTFYLPSQLATLTARKLWDDDVDFPIDWDYMFLWSDQDIYLQLIGATLNVQLLVKAKVPFVMGYDSILAAINTTPLVSGVTPSLEDIDSIVISNVTVSTANYVFFLVD